jgi:hypothetical protein
MTALSIQPTFPIFTDIDGQPLEAGYIFIGVANLAPIGNPINVYWDAALTLAAVQPIRTIGGYPVNNGTPARLYVNSDYSIQVQNRNGSVVYSAPAATERLSGVVIEVDATDVSFLQAGTGAVTRTAQAKMRDVVSVKDFGAVGNGVADDTAAIQAAIDASYTNYNKTVFVPNGIYKITGRLTITQGVMIACEGSQGSNEAYGTVFKHYSNGSCFRWDGSGAQFTGTGGGLLNCLIVKETGYSGGNAIEVINQSDTNRCGEMVFHNVLAYGLSTGRWERGFVFDGTLTNTPGARGVRTVHMTKCRAADVTTANETVLLNQVTHFYAHGLAVDTGSGSAAGITMKGINDGVYLTALGCAGSFTIVANDVSNSSDNLTIDGKIGGSFTNNDTAVGGTISIGVPGGMANKSKNLRCVLGKKPGAFIYANASLSNVTGDGTNYKVVLNTTSFDPYTNWGGNQFNVTVAGRYQVTGLVTYTNVGAAQTRSDTQILKTGGSTISTVYVENPYGGATPAGGNKSVLVSTILDCDFGDLISLNASVSGGTKTVSLVGAGGTQYTYLNVEYIA